MGQLGKCHWTAGIADELEDGRRSRQRRDASLRVARARIIGAGT